MKPNEAIIILRLKKNQTKPLKRGNVERRPNLEFKRKFLEGRGKKGGGGVQGNNLESLNLKSLSRVQHRRG